MNKLFLSALFLTAIALPSCSDDDSLAPVSSASLDNTNGIQVSINATIENAQQIAKTHLKYDDGLKAFLYKFDGSESLAFFSGKDDPKSVLVIAPGSENLTSAVFKGAIFSDAATSFYGVVPASAASDVDENGKIAITLPSEQAVAESGQFDPSAHIITSKSDKYSELTLKTANSFLCVNIPASDVNTYTSITLTSLGGENIAGTVLYDPENCTYDEKDGMSKSVTITGKFAHGSSCFISLLPCDMSEGFKLEATDAAGNQYGQVYSKKVTFNRNAYREIDAGFKQWLTLGNLEWNAADLESYKKVVFGRKSDAPSGTPTKQIGSIDVYSDGDVLYYVSDYDICLAGSLKEMFCHSTSLQEIMLSNFNTEGVTDMTSMFSQCTSLEIIELGSKFNTSIVEDMSYMFQFDSHLKTIYVKQDFQQKSGLKSKEMFFSCDNLQGQKGTKLYPDIYDAQYARIDGGEGNGGYFSKSMLSSAGFAGELGPSENKILTLE